MKKENITIDYLFRFTWNKIQKMYNEQASIYNSTMVNGFTLLSIDPKAGTPSTLLGPKMGIEPTSLSRTLKNLEEKGFIVRKPNPLDGRSVLIMLTEEGKKMREVSKNTVLQFNNTIDKEISEKDLQVFTKVALKINQIIDNNKIYNNNYEKTY